jgi:O-methyltransferase
LETTKIYTSLSEDRIANLIKYVIMASKYEGLIAEFGVFEGGSLDAIVRNAPAFKAIYGLDSFEGLPEPDERYDLKTWNICKGGMAADYDIVKKYFDEFPNVLLLKGFFPEVTQRLHRGARFCFVHVDVDLYQSVKDACEYFYPRMCKKGVIIFDDYCWGDTPGAKIAIHEYFQGLNLRDAPFLRKSICREDGTMQFQYLVIR